MLPEKILTVSFVTDSRTDMDPNLMRMNSFVTSASDFSPVQSNEFCGRVALTSASEIADPPVKPLRITSTFPSA